MILVATLFDATALLLELLRTPLSATNVLAGFSVLTIGMFVGLAQSSNLQRMAHENGGVSLDLCYRWAPAGNSFHRYAELMARRPSLLWRRRICLCRHSRTNLIWIQLL